MKTKEMPAIAKIKKEIRSVITKIDKELPKAVFHSFIMSLKEKKLFNKTVKNARYYVEFGMGGSTFKVLQKSKANVYAIDSSTEWISLMREYRQIRSAEKKNRLFLFYVDIGNTKGWGKPIDNTHKDKFPNYSSQIFNHIDKDSVDTVLVDGRFRVACTLKTIIECGQNKNLKIIIHDFWNREEYHILLKFLDVIDQVDSLGVFAIKDDIDIKSVIKEYDLYKYIFD